MTADVELLPCPFCGVSGAEVGGLVPWVQCEACDASGPQRESEADAISAWNTRAKDAEIEALRAEVERLTFEMERLQQQYDERTACMIVHRGSALACSDAVRAAYSEEHERAERLAEALRGLVAYVRETAHHNAPAAAAARAPLRDHDQEGKDG